MYHSGHAGGARAAGGPGTRGRDLAVPLPGGSRAHHHAARTGAANAARRRPVSPAKGGGEPQPDRPAPVADEELVWAVTAVRVEVADFRGRDRKSTRLNSS